MEDGEAAFFKVNVIGPPMCGKTSLINRLVCHRFDKRMQSLTDGLAGPKSYVRLSMPVAWPGQTGRKPESNVSDVLVELNDQLASVAVGDMINERPWFEVELERVDTEKQNPKPLLKQGSAVGKVNKKLEARVMTDSKTAPTAPPPSAAPVEKWVSKKKLSAAEGEADDQRVQEEAQAKKALSSTVPNPINRAHGVSGFLVAFDVNRSESFEQAKAIISQIMERMGIAKGVKRQPPLAVVLVGNKVDIGRREITYEDSVRLMAEYVTPGALLPQMRKLKMDGTILKYVEQLIAAKKADLLQLERQELEQQDDVPPEDDTHLQADWLSESVFKSLQRLRNELDPLHLTTTPCPDLDVLIGSIAALLHAGLGNVDDEYERLLACPAITVKYVEVSCRTNEEIRTLERVTLRALDLLPPLSELSLHKLPNGSLMVDHGAAGQKPGPLGKLIQGISGKFKPQVQAEEAADDPMVLLRQGMGVFNQSDAPQAGRGNMLNPESFFIQERGPPPRGAQVDVELRRPLGASGEWGDVEL
ncbi:hypothetical protein AB1Y20_001424 [Prymnesium parvum]|uniref:Uncharacterized protein n=1 Tax=Prymnesium parvum TaxID=97485 RepID=A0AB34K7Q3_PRYPA|mmetsp:Transcript_41682/g.95509  ORF Transcript_41682/g.95509 Transcript_41682/m.95509 type:complete len:531 (-) Transcript_41682:356-1948(-)